MLNKIGLAIFYLGAAVLIYAYGEPILNWLREADNPLLVLILVTAIALFPVIPFPVVGGVVGAASGPVAGAAIVWKGSTAASLLMFLFLRYFYREWGERLLNRIEGIAKINRAFERNAFLAIMFSRMLPFIPSVIVNAYSALNRVSFGTYAAASAIGKLPAMLLFALIGDHLVSDPGKILATLSVYGAFLFGALVAHRIWNGSRKNKPMPLGHGSKE